MVPRAGIKPAPHGFSVRCPARMPHRRRRQVRVCAVTHVFLTAGGNLEDFAPPFLRRLEADLGRAPPDEPTTDFLRTCFEPAHHPRRGPDRQRLAWCCRGRTLHAPQDLERNRFGGLASTMTIAAPAVLRR